MSTPSRRVRATKTTQEATGTLPSTSDAVSTRAASKSPAPRTVAASTTPAHQTHGAYTPISGPITSVHQLTRHRNVAKGSVASFSSLESYTAYLEQLSAAQLHRHAVEEAKIVPIDDRERLIRRLESEWTEIADRGRPRTPMPARQGFSAEQIKAQKDLREKMLSRGASQ